MTVSRAFIFDLDVTFACELVFGRAWSDVLTRLRLDYPSIQDDAWAMEQESQRYYDALHATIDIRIHSSINLLKRLAKHHPVAIVSGSTRRQIADAIELMDIRDYIQFYLGNEDYSCGKPDPACFLLAAHHFGMEPDQCLVFEDSSAGVRAAKAANMRCVALCRKGLPPQDVSMADEILSDLSEFTFNS